MGLEKDKVHDVIRVLEKMRSDFANRQGHVDIAKLRRFAVDAVAESGLRENRFSHLDSAQKTIRDACSRRLKPDIAGTHQFDELASDWLRTGSTKLRNILLKYARDAARRDEVIEFFGEFNRAAEKEGGKPPSKPETSNNSSLRSAPNLGFAEESDIEGIKTEVIQFRTKRSRRLRLAALNAAKGRCCVCDRDFSKVLQGRGVRVLQVHHRDQLAALAAPVLTKLSDLAVVCANCHMLLHLDANKSLRVEELRQMLQADRPLAN
jgi:hypothetical protein